MLPANNIKDIPKYRNPVRLVCCVVRPRDLSSFDAQRCFKDVDGFKFTNANGDELFSEVGYNTNLAEQKLVDEEMSGSQLPDNSTGLTPGEEGIPETGHHHSQALESLLTLDVDIPTILEEQEDEDINDWPIIEEDTYIGADQEITPIVPIPDDFIPPFPHVPIVSQNQQNDEDNPPSEDATGHTGLIMDEGTDLDAMSAHINAQLDETDDVLSAKLEVVINHRYLSGVLEFQVKYTNGDQSWHLIDLIKDEDPHCVDFYA